jgi:hypothetical protein
MAATDEGLITGVLINEQALTGASLGQVVSGGSSTVPGRAADSDNDFIFHHRIPPLIISTSMIDQRIYFKPLSSSRGKKDGVDARTRTEGWHITLGAFEIAIPMGSKRGKTKGFSGWAGHNLCWPNL